MASTPKQAVFVPPTGIGVGQHDGRVTILFAGLADQLGLAVDLDVVLVLSPDETREFVHRLLAKAAEVSGQ